IARMCGVDPKLRIVPFRGQFYKLPPHRRHVVRNLIYPVPDPRFPFLGIHLTRTIHGDVEVGPNAVPAFRRDGYHRWSFSLADTLSWAGYRGFHRLARVHWRTGLAEFARSASRRAFAAAVRRLIPELAAADLVRARSGVRAQAVDRNGALVDDFRIIDTDDTLHVLNAPSPAATAAIAVGRHIARTATARFGID
ncbi:MAG: FAD-dependent oxidoreductase, partial [Phycisphaerae bacterium]